MAVVVEVVEVCTQRLEPPALTPPLPLPVANPVCSNPLVWTGANTSSSPEGGIHEQPHGGNRRGGTKVVRRWTQGMKGDVAAREQAYQELVLERSTSRQLLDGLRELSQSEVRMNVLIFSNADTDGDGVSKQAVTRGNTAHLTT